jgi:hypothetical protein
MGATVVITSQAWQDLSEIIDYKVEPEQKRLLALRFWHSARDLGKITTANLRRPQFLFHVPPELLKCRAFRV